MHPDDLDQPDRRDLLLGSLLGAGLASFGLPLLAPPAVAADRSGPATLPDFTLASAALEPDQVVRSACQFCNSLCGLKVHLKAGRVIDIRGEDNDPVQAGQLCVKAHLMPQLVYNRFRLTRPLKRTGGARGSPDSSGESSEAWTEPVGIGSRRWATGTGSLCCAVRCGQSPKHTTGPCACAIPSATRQRLSTMWRRVLGETVRTVPVNVAVSGMMLCVVPALRTIAAPSLRSDAGTRPAAS